MCIIALVLFTNVSFISFTLLRDNLLPVTSVGLFLHLLVTYGVTNKPFSLVSKGNFQKQEKFMSTRNISVITAVLGSVTNLVTIASGKQILVTKLAA